MECLPTTDDLALITLAISILVGGILAYHAYLFRSQAETLIMSVEDARRKEKREFRAYIAPTGKCVITENKMIPFSSSRSFWVEAKIENTGRTTAINVVYKWKLEPINTDSFDGSLGKDFRENNLPEIGPRQKWKITGTTMPTDCKWQEIISGNEFINFAFFGIIEYGDIFGDTYTVPFAFIYNRNYSVGGEKMNWIQPKKNPQQKN